MEDNKHLLYIVVIVAIVAVVALVVMITGNRISNSQVQTDTTGNALKVANSYPVPDAAGCAPGLCDQNYNKCVAGGFGGCEENRAGCRKVCAEIGGGHSST